MVGKGIAEEVRERERMRSKDSGASNRYNERIKDNEYLTNNTQAKLKRKFHQQQWNKASEPILDGGQGKKICYQTRHHTRRGKAARKTKEVSVYGTGFLCEQRFTGHAGVRVQQRRVVDMRQGDDPGEQATSDGSSGKGNTRPDMRATNDCPGRLTTGAKVGYSPFVGTVTSQEACQSSHPKHDAGVKEGVREARKASDLGTAGDTMVETRPKSGHSDANVAPMHASPSLKVGHSAPGTGMECGLEQPRMESGAEVTGATKNKHRKENKRKRIAKQLAQDPMG